MDKIIGLKELRENTEKYITEVEKGKSFTVVRKSKPVFKLTPIDEEESGWETVIDFTKYRKGGMPIEEVLRRLKKLK
jgi:prevent-host-death family protein